MRGKDKVVRLLVGIVWVWCKEQAEAAIFLRAQRSDGVNLGSGLGYRPALRPMARLSGYTFSFKARILLLFEPEPG